MTKIPKKWYDKLVDTCAIQSCSTNEKLMFLYLHNKLIELGLNYNIDTEGNMIITKGKSKTYPCVVCHIDTVHSFVNDYTIYVSKDKNILFAKDKNKYTGIGGDDKCGILSCLYFLETLPAVKVVFFSREEVGCKGSGGINLDIFNNCRYILQLDRRGGQDTIEEYYGDRTISNEFASLIGGIKKKYKFKKAKGTVTDCMKLWYREVGISCMNISSGYYEPHSIKEYIKVNELWNSIRFAKEIITTLKAKKYKCKPPDKNYYNNNTTKSIYGHCAKCKAVKLESVLWEIDGKTYCYQCMKDIQKNKQNKYTNVNILTKTTDKDKHLYNVGYYNCASCNTKGNGKWDYRNGQQFCKDCYELIKEIDNTGGCCRLCYTNYKIKDLKLHNGDYYCRDCYEYREAYNKYNKPKVINESCAECGQQVSNTNGKYDGEIFICNACLNKNKTDIVRKCDMCDMPIGSIYKVLSNGSLLCDNCLDEMDIMAD